MIPINETIRVNSSTVIGTSLPEFNKGGRYNVLTSLMPYTAHRKDSRHRIVTNAEISPCTYYLDGEIESSQKGPVSYWDNSAHSSIEIISISFILKLEKGSPVTAALSSLLK